MLVLILSFALAAVSVSLISTLTTDKRVNHRAQIAAQARNAAEGVVEVAVAEIDRRAASYSSMQSSLLNGYIIPEATKTYLADSGIEPTSIEFKAGNLSPLPNEPVVIDGNDPFNFPDLDKGKPVILRHAYVFGKAAAKDPVTGHLVTSYVSNLVQVREQTWLNYAVFYNLDMEMHSGSTMDIDGPVHTNRDAFLTAGSGQTLRFFGSLTTTKRIYRKYKYGGTVTHTGDVQMTPKENPSASDLLAMATNQDSTKSGFKTFAENRWKGFVQDISFSVPPFNPPGILQYVPDDHTTTSVDEMRNPAYAMIEPQLADVSADVPASGLYSGFKGLAVENQKFSALAGLTIRVKESAQWPVKPPHPVTPAPITSDNNTLPGYELVFYMGANSSRPVNRNNLPVRGAAKNPVEYVVDLTKMKPELRTKLYAAIKVIRYGQTGTVGNSSLTATDHDPLTSGTQSWYGIYDRRQGYQKTSSNNGLKGAHHAVHIDMEKFHDFINAPSAEWEDATDSSKKVYDPGASYSGVVYVQFPLLEDTHADVSSRSATDKIRPAKAPTVSTAGYALILRNAKKLPQLPSDLNLRDDGLTLATNGPVYIMGHYNADGSSSTGSSREPDDPNVSTSTEVPALIAADSVTLLSSAYSDSDMSASATTLNSAAFTEVSAGIIAGIVPTRLNSSGVGSNNQWAGGVHNFVRFLENWSGDTYCYRGSVVCLYENEVHKGPWYQSEYTYWYNFPARDVGYHVYFAGGRFPPGLPVMRTIRRISVADITAAIYNAGPPTPPAAAN